MDMNSFPNERGGNERREESISHEKTGRRHNMTQRTCEMNLSYLDAEELDHSDLNEREMSEKNVKMRENRLKSKLKRLAYVWGGSGNER